ncbi:MAG: efflux RND transporter periplasmic adaptor subunit [Bacteroidetes bacterium]|nr:efflux RND transporter periplasmic adaptor subunit [Bacteroidota bacterium]
MKRIMNIVVAAEIIFLASCGANASKENPSVLTEKKAKLEQLKQQQTKLNSDIQTLQDEIDKIDTASAKKEKAKLVALTTLTAAPFTHYIDLQGKVDALNVAYVAPRNGTGGIVTAVYVKQGDNVKKGQLLLKLDDVIARQNVKSSEQSLAATKAQLDLAKDLYKRRQNLWNQGIGTEVDVLTAKTNAENLEAQYSAQQESLKNAQQQLNFTSVYSDIDGVANTVNVRVGEAFTGAIPGTSNPQILIVNTQNLKATAQVPELYLSKVKIGSMVKVNLPELNRTLDLKVTAAGKLIDPNTRSFYIEAKMPYDKDFRPNQIALVKIQDYAVPNALAVPVSTVQNDEKGKYVLVAVKEGDKMVARKKPVTIGLLYGDKIEIKSGLQAGDVIITDGVQGLYDGQAITTGQ